ncbi:hypothetical protein ABZ848_16925 [Streptomyces sp. NPDC047081]|uniref:hypothetical protein n=1 Tax=Streptomyces sp. NPDC047081 TaxID=3154706 RepID=UPI0033D1785F
MQPGPTVTKTVKVKVEPAPTVTVTRTAPTVTVTRTAAAQAAGADSGSADSAGTCSIVSSSGNCYSAGQYCRNSDHGAVTTTAGGSTIKCVYRSNAWRWSYA